MPGCWQQIRTIHAVAGDLRVPRGSTPSFASAGSTGRPEAGRPADARGGLAGRQPAQVAVTTTARDAARRPAPDLVEREFAATAPNQLWVADITYIPTWAGFLYLAVVLDAWSRRIVGWSMATHLRTELVLDALEMAVGAAPADGRHPPLAIKAASTRRWPSASAAARLASGPRWARSATAYDNAMCESFFATLECELLDRITLETPAEGRVAVFHFIEGWYNPTRRHSGLDYLSPVEFERQGSGRARSTGGHTAEAVA